MASLRGKHLKAIPVAAAIAVAVSACGAPELTTPDELGEAVAEAINDQDFDAIKELTCDKDRDEIAEEINFDKTRADLDAEDLEISVEFLKAEADGDKASLTFTTTLDNLPERLADLGMPTTSNDQQSAKRTDAQWSLCN
ncbi:MAG: hypothetical protein GEU86_21370 [Actinophytocola sp.]|nr:hypothetical protein [Actinophytocola sp.]